MHSLVHRRELGFGLIESLVALVVVSVGMIGIAALYGQGLGASRTALYRTQAVNLASSMADRIRLNRGAGVVYEAAGAGADNSCEPGGAACTPAQMAAHDLWVWNNELTQQLPAGVGDVRFTANVPPTYTIRVRWQEVGLGTMQHLIAVRVPDL